MNKSRTQRYDTLQKLFHWSIAGLIVLQFVLAKLAEGAEDADAKLQQLALLANHKSVGITVLMLAVLRLGWRVVRGAPPLPAAMPRWQSVASHASHTLLYALLFALPLSGWLMSSASAYPVSWFGLVQLPDLVGADADLKHSLETLHEVLARALFVIASVHILAALKHGLFDRDGVLSRISSPLSLVLFVLVIGGGLATLARLGEAPRRSDPPAVTDRTAAPEGTTGDKVTDTAADNTAVDEDTTNDGGADTVDTAAPPGTSRDRVADTGDTAPPDGTASDSVTGAGDTAVDGGATSDGGADTSTGDGGASAEVAEERVADDASDVGDAAAVEAGTEPSSSPASIAPAAAPPPPAAAADAVASPAAPAPGTAPATTAPAPPAAWSIDRARSVIEFSAEQAGARFTGRWEEWQATLRFDPALPDLSRFDVTVQTDSAATGDAERDGYLTDREWFDHVRHPTALFLADRFERDSQGRWRADGEFQAKGKSTPLTLTFTVEESGTQRTLRGSARIDRLAAGIGTGEWTDTEWVGRYVDVTVDVFATVR